MTTPQFPQTPGQPGASTPQPHPSPQHPVAPQPVHPPAGGYPAQYAPGYDAQGQNLQGQYAQAQYAPAQYPQGQYAHGQYPPPAAPGAGTRNPLGLVSVIIGVLPLVLGFIWPFLSLAVARGGAYDAIGIASGVLNGLSLVLGLAALVIGLIAILRPGLPKALAGIGVGLGVAAAWGGLTGFLYPVVMQFMY